MDFVKLLAGGLSNVLILASLRYKCSEKVRHSKLSKLLTTLSARKIHENLLVNKELHTQQ